jgi:hypothetical protein
MATALTLGIRQDISTAVTNYFRRFRVLPPRGLTVSNTRVLTGAHSFETLLRGIIAQKSETDFVIVVHGHETGKGLFLKLVTRAGAAFGSETTSDMLETLMAIDARRPPTPPAVPGKPAPKRAPASPTPAELTKLGELTDAEVNRLIDLMTQVRAKNLKLVEFRGCNLGLLADSIDRFRRFLGAQIFGAPNLHSFFGTFQMKASPDIMLNHTSSHSGITFTYPMTFPGSSAACCFGTNTERKPEDGHLIAPDAAGLDAWIQANIDKAASSGKPDKELPIHGLWERPPKPHENAPDPIPRPIFPLGTIKILNVSHNEYTTRIKYSP